MRKNKRRINAANSFKQTPQWFKNLFEGMGE